MKIDLPRQLIQHDVPTQILIDSDSDVFVQCSLPQDCRSGVPLRFMFLLIGLVGCAV